MAKKYIKSKDEEVKSTISSEELAKLEEITKAIDADETTNPVVTKVEDTSMENTNEPKVEEKVKEVKCKEIKCQNLADFLF